MRRRRTCRIAAGCTWALSFLIAAAFGQAGAQDSGTPEPSHQETGAAPAQETPSGAPAAARAGTPAAELLGKDICLTCHDLEAVYARTAHAQQECESCHGPGSLHVEAGGDSSLSLRTRPPRTVAAQCATCHGRDHELSAFPRSAHARANIACISCHQVHPAKPNFQLLKAEQRDLCATCHQNVQLEFRKPFHHPVQEGAVQCSDCHKPHSEDRRPLQRLALGTEDACVACHSEKRGPFVFEHAVVKTGGCESCHQPHGSSNPKLLRRHDMQQVCLECHTLTPGTAGAQPPAFHDIRTARFQNCTTCHREIHGSNASPVFLR